jgi:hypothetical protein
MSAQAASWLAWSLWLLYVVLAALEVAFLFLADFSYAAGNFAALTVLLVFPTIGALVASRQPRNPVGWIFCVQGLAFSLGAFYDTYARYALVERPGSLPGGVIMAWFANLLWLPTSALGILLLLLVFPTGRLLSRRWRVWVVFAISGTVLGTASVALVPGELYGYSSPPNPFGISGAQSILEAAGLVGFLLLSLSLVASIVSLILRFRRSRGSERQQIKWLLYDAILVGFVVPVAVLNEGESLLVSVVVLSALTSMPVAVGVAILKYRLYDIDLLINRTLVYGALTAALVAAYFGGVVGLQWVFRALTGGSSQLAVVASTLAIAALFDPLRRRTQSFVDRLFYRRKYDAAKTLAAFNLQLRDEKALDALSGDLVGVVRETMQPAHVSLWLRPAPAPKESEGPEQPHG